MARVPQLRKQAELVGPPPEGAMVMYQQSLLLLESPSSPALRAWLGLAWLGCAWMARTTE